MNAHRMGGITRPAEWTDHLAHRTHCVGSLHQGGRCV